MMLPRHQRTMGGFTLLEVLVALCILAFGLSATTRAVSATTDTVDALHTRQLASWLAQNRLSLLRATRQWPAPGESAGEATMDGRKFVWRMHVSTLGQSTFRRVEFTVFQSGAGGKAAPLSRLVGFIAPLQ